MIYLLIVSVCHRRIIHPLSGDGFETSITLTSSILFPVFHPFRLDPMIMPLAFQIHPSDNVATLLDDVAVGDNVELIGGQPGTIQAISPVASGHKIALTPLAEGSPVLKYGVRIGHATGAIAKGEWVHLQNLASDLDERSAGLDLHTGVPSDTSSAYV